MNQIVNAYGSRVTGYPKINLDHVVEFRPFEDDHGLKAWRCINAAGEEIGVVGDHELPTGPSGVVPDRTGAVLVGFWPSDRDEPFIVRYPVIAWSVYGKWADPITYELLPRNWCLELRVPPDDKPKYVFPEDATFDSFDEAVEHVKKYFPQAGKTAGKGDGGNAVPEVERGNEREVA